MVHRRYRVTQPLPWLEGGRPGRRGTWIGEAVIYQPGATIALTDRDVVAIYHHLEATSPGGRAALDRACAAMEAPAACSDFRPKDRGWLIRATTDKLREQGRFQDVVVRMLARGVHPRLADLIAALEEDVPIPHALRRYIVATYLRRTPGRRPGPNRFNHSTGEVLAISAYFEYELMRAHRTHANDSRAPQAFAAVAKRATAPAFGLTTRTLERVLTQRPSHREPPM